MSLKKIIFLDVLSCFLLLTFASTVQANSEHTAQDTPSFYVAHAQGWHWYDDPLPEKTQKATPPSPDPVLNMEAVKAAIKKSLDQALLNPTPQNVGQYMLLQHQWTAQAYKFSKVWAYVLLQHPELDEALQFPTNQPGRDIYIDQQKRKEEAAIHQLASHSGLFYFYRSNCPYCQRFSPILKDFSARYGITVIPITTDGIALPEFPDSRVDKGQAQRFHVTEEPALFTVDPYTQKATPVSYGLLTEEELRARMLDIATHFEGEVS